MGRSRMSILKRQREVKKAEKRRQKQAKKHGISEPTFMEPQPTVRLSDAGIVAASDDDDDDEEDTTSEE